MDMKQLAGAATEGGGGSLFDSLTSNPVFAGGAGIAGLGIVMAAFRQGALQGINMFKRFYSVSLEIPSKDRSYPWVLQWIARHGARQQHLGVETSFSQSREGRIRTAFSFVPAPGQHFFSYKGRWLRVFREREKSVVDFQSGQPWESVKLTTYGRSKEVFEELLQEAREEALRAQEGKTIIYTSLGTDWVQFGRPRKRRPLDSVVLDSGIKERLADDVQEFSQSAKWYLDRGIPYRRGYLLHGPPGCGKTSFITALAGALEYNICILNLNERGLTDDRLTHLLSIPPPRSFILLEDIDAALGGATSERERERHSYSVTMSGLLNALDGVASTEERIVFMTTNHKERLDHALVRPGRVDVMQLITYATAEQCGEMFRRFYPQRDLGSSATVRSSPKHNTKGGLGSDKGKSVTKPLPPKAAVKGFAPTSDNMPNTVPHSLQEGKSGERDRPPNSEELAAQFVAALEQAAREAAAQSGDNDADFDIMAGKLPDYLGEEAGHTDLCQRHLRLSVAEIQGFFMLYKSDPQACVRNVRSVLLKGKGQIIPATVEQE